MKKFLFALFMLFISRNCFAYTIREAWDIYYDSAWGKRIITIYTNGFIKGYTKGYAWKMSKAENVDNETITQYEKCLRQSTTTDKLLKQAFSQFMKNRMDPDIQLDVFLTAGLASADLECSLQKMKNTIDKAEAKYAE